jgi:hypothetical protein
MLSLGPAHSEELGRAYAEALRRLSGSSIPFLIGGAHGLMRYLEVERETKDLDVFICPGDIHRTLRFFQERGHRTELTFPHWLGKIHCGPGFIDVIFSSGNSIARVDADWFANARDGEVLGIPVKLCPPEEMIWSKAFVQERERFDGADVMHLIHHFGEGLDWQRLIDRFDVHWRVLFGFIVMFGFVYPDQRHRVPAWVVDTLNARFLREQSDGPDKVCNGTLLSREQYLHDVCVNGYQDARTIPPARMKPEELEIWTAAIGAKYDE